MIRLETDLPGVSPSALTHLLAAEIAAAFGERVLIVRPPRNGERPHVSPVRAEDGTFRAVAAAAADLWIRSGDFDHVLLDGFDAVPAGLVDTAVRIVGAGSSVAGTSGALTTLRTVVAARRGAATAIRAGTPAEPVAPRAPAGGELAGVPSDDAHAGDGPRSCRLALSGDVLASGSVRREALDAASRESLARLARAVTGRRVGVALSGGGAWGFVHVVLLRRLVRRGVPIDVITASSMGATVGAYFAARGLPGLDRLVERATRGDLDLAALFAVLSTASIERLLLADLGPLRLEDLPVRFCPITTDLTEGSSVALVKGPLARAVRASSSAPGLWAPTIDGSARYVDGAVSNHLPARLLRRFGAGLTLASNCYPHDRGIGAARPRSRATELLAGWSPVRRALDLARSGSLLLHRNGDHGGRDADVFFDIAPQDDPIARAFRFRRAPSVIAWAEQNEDLHRAADEMASAWSGLARRARAMFRRAA